MLLKCNEVLSFFHCCCFNPDSIWTVVLTFQKLKVSNKVMLKRCMYIVCAVSWELTNESEKDKGRMSVLALYPVFCWRRLLFRRWALQKPDYWAGNLFFLLVTSYLSKLLFFFIPFFTQRSVGTVGPSQEALKKEKYSSLCFSFLLIYSRVILVL